MDVCEIQAYGGSKEVIDALISNGMMQLYPPQELAVKAGLLEGDESFVIAAPTASGKTLVGEMAALKAHFESKGKVLYTVPLRALAREKYDEFTRKYRKFGLGIVQSTGDFDSNTPWLREADIIIATNEKIDSLIRHRAGWLSEVSLIVADEIHLMADIARGPTLEVVLTRLRMQNPDLRTIALSATIPNAEELAGWLSARLVRSDWRPVPLREGVYYGESLIFNDGSVKWVEKQWPDDALTVALDTIREGGQALVFVSTRKAAEAVARKAAPEIASLRGDADMEASRNVAKDISDASSEPTKLGRKVAELAAKGVAFHHAGLISSQRRLIEDGFRANRIKLVAATTTLAMGLNLPARRVVIRDWRRYESGQGMRPVPVLEIKQMAGRAGRPGFDQWGEAVLIAKSRRDERYLFEHYIKADPEDIDSQLANESVLRSHILSAIAGGFARDRKGLEEFLGHTFFAYREGVTRLAALANDILDFLILEDLVREDRGLTASRFGRRVSELYIDPLTGVVLRNALRMPEEKSAFGLFNMISRTPDMMVLQVKKGDVDRLLEVFSVSVRSLLLPEEERHATDEVLGQIKTALLLTEWINEASEDGITNAFGVGPGDLHGIVDLADWLLYSASEVAKIFSLKDEERAISPLRTRVLYGVREELLPLVSLRGIGRVRARSLFDGGYKTPNDIRTASAYDLEKVPAIGRTVADDIKKQVEAARPAA